MKRGIDVLFYCFEAVAIGGSEKLPSQQDAVRKGRLIILSDSLDRY